MLTQLTFEPTNAPTDQDAVEDWIGSLQVPFLWNLTPSLVQTNISRPNVVFAKRKRQTEFSAGRQSAESLLKRFGNWHQVGVNADRSPAWPTGFIGSISHSQSWTLTSVAQDGDLKSIGIDTESVVDSMTREEIQQDIATSEEWKTCEKTNLNQNQIFSVVFSAKEAFYKCWYPQTKAYFGFEHAIVDAASPTSIHICMTESNPNFGMVPNPLEVFFHATDEDVFTMTWMELA